MINVAEVFAKNADDVTPEEISGVADYAMSVLGEDNPDIDVVLKAVRAIGYFATRGILSGDGLAVEKIYIAVHAVYAMGYQRGYKNGKVLGAMAIGGEEG